MFNNKSSDIAHTLMDHASHSAETAMDATQRVANDALDGASHSLQVARRQIRNSAHHASDKTAAFVRNEPVKSILLAAATGAVLMALVQAIGGPRHPR